MPVAPVLAAAIAAVLIFKPPVPFGIWKSTAPSTRSMVRIPSLKLTIVFAPRRVIVWSANVNSLRPAAPVLIASPSRTLSPTAARRGAAACGGPSFTSFATCVTRVSCNCAAFKQVAVRRRQMSKPRPQLSARGAEVGGRLFMALEFQRQRYPAANVGHAVIEDAVIGLIPGERAESAQCEPVQNPIVCAQGKYFVNVGSIAGIIIAHDKLKRSVERKGATQSNIVAAIERVIVSPR